MQFSQDAIDLIKEFEGFKATPYKCLAGQYTIGYGKKLSGLPKHNYQMTENEAYINLKLDLITYCSFINQKLKVTLTQGQYDALSSLVYNWGCFSFSKSEGLKLLNQKKFNLAAHEFFSKEKGVVHIHNKVFCQGLYRRRQAERKLWDKK